MLHKFIIKIRNFLNNRKADLAIQVLTIISLISFSLETLPGISVKASEILYVIEIVTISIFTIEYFLRIISSKKPFKFIISWWGIVDILAILPYYLSTYVGIGVDLRAIRVLRLFRLVRILKIFRNNNALKRIIRSLVLAREEFFLFLGLSAIILYISSVGIYYFENPIQPEKFQSIPHSLWWSVVTLTTVGYGDVYPITVGGKIFTGIIVFVGLGFIAMPASIMTAALSQARNEENTLGNRGDV